MKSLKNSCASERAETKIMVIAILMGIAVLWSVGTVVAGWMHDEMLDRSKKGEEQLRHYGKHPRRKPDTERPIRGQTLRF